MRIPTQSGSTLLRVEAACCDEVPPLLARPGDSWYRRPGDDDPPVLCAVAGALSDDTSTEVVALLSQGSAPARGERVRLGSAAAVFRKPRGLSFSAAAQLMLPALTACAALQAARLPPPGTGGGGGSRPCVVVAGSTGRLPGLLSQMLRDAGCAPLVAGRAPDAEAVRALGAQFIDHDAASFAATAGGVHAVLDVLGREEDPELVQEYMDARYVSLAPPPLTRLADDGALAALRRRWGENKKPRQPWLPNPADGDEQQPPNKSPVGSSATVTSPPTPPSPSPPPPSPPPSQLLLDVEALLRRVDAGAVVPPPLPLGGLTQELSAQYAEYLGWARDGDSGLRFGFPGRDLWAVEDSGRPEFASSKNQASEVRYAAPPLIYSPRIEVPRIDLYGLTGLAEDDD